MNKKILLTSFTTWLPHHKSNSSDDLLQLISQDNFPNLYLEFIRQLPVNIPQATNIIIQHLKISHPDIVICCGMAEKRTTLTLESNANWRDKTIYTPVNLEQIITQLSYTQISHNSGKFVCEGLYYRILNYLSKHHPKSKSVFVHVPILNENNLSLILEDMKIVIQCV